MSTDRVAVMRSMMVYAVCLPLAIFLGYLLVKIANDPYGSMVSTGMVALLLLLMVLPLFLRWYHPWLITVWNSSLLFVFLPGQLQGWTILAILGFGIAIGHKILHRESRFLSAPSVTRSLIFLAIVVAVTAKLRGGIGLHVFGDESIGGKRYILIWVAIMGYFAITSQAIAPNKRKLMAVLFILSGATAVISDIVGRIGGPLTYIGLIFPVTDSSVQLQQSIVGDEGIVRYGGLGTGCLAMALTLLAYFGIEGLLDLRKLWRAGLFLAALFLTTYGGFRGLFIFAIMMVAFTFYFEGLFRSRLLPLAVLGSLLLFGGVLAFSDHLPLQFQRCLAFLPIKLDPVAKANAEGSSDWRLEIWESLVPQIPHYLLLGKGLGIDFNNLVSYYQFGNSQVGGDVGGTFTVSGDYHNGPLSVTIQFGIWGVIGLVWFWVASLKALWSNYKYGDPEIKRLNTFLLCYFIGKIIMFLFVFGSFYTDIMIFTGIIGFSVSLNGGVARPAPVVRPKIVFNRFRPLPVPATTG